MRVTGPSGTGRARVARGRRVRGKGLGDGFGAVVREGARGTHAPALRQEVAAWPQPLVCAARDLGHRSLNGREAEPDSRRHVPLEGLCFAQGMLDEAPGKLVHGDKAHVAAEPVC